MNFFYVIFERTSRLEFATFTLGFVLSVYVGKQSFSSSESTPFFSKKISMALKQELCWRRCDEASLKHCFAESVTFLDTSQAHRSVPNLLQTIFPSKSNFNSFVHESTNLEVKKAKSLEEAPKYQRFVSCARFRSHHKKWVSKVSTRPLHTQRKTCQLFHHIFQL